MSTPRVADASERTTLLAGTWRLLITPPMSGAANMALDHALMERARRIDERVFRVYTWSQPTVSLGRHQVARNRIDPAVARRLGVGLVRRPTGGRALLHHREVTYSVTTALSRADSVRDWYDAINAVLLDGLRALGVRAQSAVRRGPTPLPATASCFVQPDEGEITVGGRKLVGSALVRQRDALLQHGSILLDDDQPMLDELLPDDEARPAPAGTLRQALDVVPRVIDVAGALFNALGCVAGVETSMMELGGVSADEVSRWERVYASEEWTFKR